MYIYLLYIAGAPKYGGRKPPDFGGEFNTSSLILRELFYLITLIMLSCVQVMSIGPGGVGSP